MKWIKYTIESSVEAEDIISSMLMELGVTGVEIEDSIPLSDEELEAMFVDPDAKELRSDEVPDIEGSRISFYVRIPDGEDDKVEELESSSTVDASYTIHDRLWTEDEITELLGVIRRGLDSMSAYVDIGAGRITTDYTEAREWIDKWKEYYKPLIAGNILIIPYWEEIPEEHRSACESGELKIVKLNPGSAFGSGSHGTTRLCIDGIRKYIRPSDKLIDIGSGSGILGLSAIRNGASYVHSVELDPACEHIMEENLILNDINPEDFRIEIGNILEDDDMRAAAGSDFDILVANILAPVTATLAGPGQADALVRRGGYFVTSGIAKMREHEVLDAFARNPEWKVIDRNETDEWVALVAERV